MSVSGVRKKRNSERRLTDSLVKSDKEYIQSLKPFTGESSSISGNPGGTNTPNNPTPGGAFLPTAGGSMIGPIAFFQETNAIVKNRINLEPNVEPGTPESFSTYVQMVGTIGSPTDLKFIDNAQFSGQYLIAQPVATTQFTIRNATLPSISNITGTGTTVTVTTSINHNLATGDVVNIINTTAFDVGSTDVTVTSPTVFTYDATVMGTETSGEVQDGNIITGDGDDILLNSINALTAPLATLIFDTTITGGGGWRVIGFIGGGGGGAANWSFFPALTNVDIATFDIKRVDRLLFQRDSTGFGEPQSDIGIVATNTSDMLFNAPSDAQNGFFWNINGQTKMVLSRTDLQDDTILTLESQSDGAVVRFHTFNGAFTPTVNSDIFRARFFGKNSADLSKEYAGIKARVNFTDEGDEEGELQLLTTVGGDPTPFIILNNLSDGRISLIRDVFMGGTNRQMTFTGSSASLVKGTLIFAAANNTDRIAMNDTTLEFSVNGTTELSLLQNGIIVRSSTTTSFVFFTPTDVVLINDGQMFYDLSENKFKGRENGVTQNLIGFTNPVQIDGQLSNLPTLTLNRTDVTADNQNIGDIIFQASDDTGMPHQWARIRGFIEDNNDADAEGRLDFSVSTDDNDQLELFIRLEGDSATGGETIELHRDVNFLSGAGIKGNGFVLKGVGNQTIDASDGNLILAAGINISSVEITVSDINSIICFTDRININNMTSFGANAITSTGDITPGTTNTFDLGTQGNAYDKIFVTTVRSGVASQNELILATPTMVLNAGNANDTLRIGADGTVLVQSNASGNLGFFSTLSSSAQQTITGSRNNNVALANLLTALAAYNLIVDSTTL